MIINLIYIFITIFGMYFGIRMYVFTKNPMMLRFSSMLTISLGLEIRWLNLGLYITDMTDVFRKMRDIVWTIFYIIGMKMIYDRYGKDVPKRKHT